MKICIAQTRPVKGDIEANIVDHINWINQAVNQNADFIIFSELSLTGYEPELAKELAIEIGDTRLNGFQEISDVKDIIICVGVPTKAKNGTCISLVIFQPNKERSLYSKQYLHEDELPYFVPALRIVASLKQKSGLHWPSVMNLPFQSMLKRLIKTELRFTLPAWQKQ